MLGSLHIRILGLQLIRALAERLGINPPETEDKLVRSCSEVMSVLPPYPTYHDRLS